MPDHTDAALFQQMRDELFVAAVGDVLDTMGYQRQFLPAGIMPLDKSMRIIGRAMPVLEADVINDGARAKGPLSGKP
ncbi:MAG: hypothetical protein ABWZ88_00145, partial [Variovorax sp.]